MIEMGIPETQIYRGWKNEIPGRFHMRAGEYLGVLDGLRAFGNGKRAVNDAVSEIHGGGATILDIETGQDSRTHGVAMANEASRPRTLSPEAKRLLADERADKYRQKNGMMLKTEAYKVWWNRQLSVAEKIEITRWSKSALYNTFGNPGAPAGRRPKKLFE